TGEPALATHPAHPAHPADPPHPDGLALVCPAFDAVRGESRYLIFDAADVEAGPCAEVRLEAPLPTAFHAAFAPALPQPPPVDPS
ncbi:MAG: carotenoid oxygenase family protein, partial [Acidobacteria bacterium]|nr:carotenoid oxygenase family protein [Acidobacteriota bacterium]